MSTAAAVPGPASAQPGGPSTYDKLILSHDHTDISAILDRDSRESVKIGAVAA
jgi:hypothetical protein